VSIHFPDLRSPEVKVAAESGAVPVLPVGQTEEHGPHLPINTDAFIARRVCEEAGAALAGNPPSYVLDTICYGYSQKALKGWPGTFVVPQQTLIETIKHVLVSLADMGFKKIVVVSTHGNHTGVLRVVARMVADECGVGPGLFFPCAAAGEVMKKYGKAGPGGSCHAGELETSLMLHLAPERVDMSAAVSSDKLTSTVPYSSSEAFISTWTRQGSRSGAYGDPTVATPGLGKRLFETLVAETAKFIRYYHGLKQI